MDRAYNAYGVVDEEPDLDHARLLQLISTGVSRARREDRPILVSHTERVALADALPFFAAGRSLDQPAFFWEHGAEGFSIAGVGAAYRIESTGHERFTRSAQDWQRLLEHAVVDGLDTQPGSGPTLLGGFAFDPQHTADPTWHGFGHGSLVLPTLQLTTNARASSLTCNIVVEPWSEPETLAESILDLANSIAAMPRARMDVSKRPAQVADLLAADTWKSLVRNATGAIQRGEFEKVVLARAVRVVAPEVFDLTRILDELRGAYANAYVFAVTRGESCFIGATPERLVGVRSGVVRASALAGTAARGETAAEDEALGQQLLASPKDRHEHAVVVEMLRAAFAELCVDLYAPPAPTLWRLSNVQHLYTPVTGRLRPQHSLLDLVARLHPTPAVGGLPREGALDYIRAHEQLDRGWYAAPVGWLDARGEGDFAVALRSGILHGREASLFAGCGIVAESDPEREYAETCLKLRPMSRALGIEQA